jgi:non-canonical (house-cleaning) NTP pyrophosphatase
MAGAFGYEAGDHYDVSIKAGERVLLPKVREATEDTLIIADGFSCVEQVQQTTEREPIHLAEVMQMALQRKRQQRTRRRVAGLGLGLAAGALTVGALAVLRSKNGASRENGTRGQGAPGSTPIPTTD